MGAAISPADIPLQLLDRKFLLTDDRLYEVADRDDADEFAFLHNR